MVRRVKSLKYEVERLGRGYVHREHRSKKGIHKAYSPLAKARRNQFKDRIESRKYDEDMQEVRENLAQQEGFI